MYCYRLWTMLYIYIQKGKEAMKTVEFQQNIRGTEVCMKRIMISKKGCGHITPKDNYFTDRCFSGVKAAE